jgi:hypothetical protein
VTRGVTQPWAVEPSPKLVCDCKNKTFWTEVVERHTGSMFYQCNKCGKLTTITGYVDWSVGLFLDDGQTIGSRYTLHCRKELFTKRSGLTT